MAETAEIEWQRIEVEAFEEAGEKVELWTAKVEVRSPLAAELLLDPLPHLIDQIAEVTTTGASPSRA